MTILFKQTPEILFTPDLETLSFPISDQGHEYWEEKIIEPSESLFNNFFCCIWYFTLSSDNIN